MTVFKTLAVCLISLFVSSPVIPENSIRFIDSRGSEIGLLQSVEVKGNAYLPLDKVCQIFDGQLQRYEPVIGRATIEVRGKNATFFVGQTKVVNTKSLTEISLSSPPLLISGKLMVPIDFLSSVMANLAEVGVKVDRNRSQVRVENIFETAKPKFNPLTSNKSRRNLIVDPGHGGKDPGAKSESGSVEKEVNLRLAKLIRQVVSQFNVEAYLTRDDDRSLLPSARVDFANFYQGEAFISIHAAFVSESESEFPMRCSIYVNRGTFSQSSVSDERKSPKRLLQSDFYDESWVLAKVAKSELESRGFEIQRLSEAPLAGLRDVYMPAILVEISYPTKSNFEGESLESEMLQLSAEAISEAVVKIFKR